MSDISKNDVVGFAQQILNMQKRIDELERVNAALEKMANGVKQAVDKLKLAFEEFRNSTFPPGRSDETDHEVAKP
jgi:predicted nuclease with TOPRIM domain